MCDSIFHAAEHRLTESRRAAGHNAFHNAADRIAVCLCRKDCLLHLLANFVCYDGKRLAGYSGCARRAVCDTADGYDARKNFNPFLPQQL